MRTALPHHMNMTVYAGNSSPINVSFVAKQRKTHK